MSARRIDTAEVAKLIRADLKRVYPSIKFSVRSRRYTGGSSIDVDWTDGPVTKEVESLIGWYKGSTFDGMIDLRSYHNSELNGEQVHFGSDHIFCQRHYSPEFYTRMVKETCEKWGVDYTDSLVKLTSGGSPYVDSHVRVKNADEWLSTLVHREIYPVSLVEPIKEEAVKVAPAVEPIKQADPVKAAQTEVMTIDKPDFWTIVPAAQLKLPEPSQPSIGVIETETADPLEALALAQAEQSFQADFYTVMDHETRIIEGLALMLSHYFKWAGVPIMKVAALALEDANFHSESSAIDEMIAQAMGSGY